MEIMKNNLANNNNYDKSQIIFENFSAIMCDLAEVFLSVQILFSVQ